MGRPKKPTGSIDEARIKAGIVHPLGHREYPDYAAEDLDWSGRDEEGAGGTIGALRRLAKEAEEAVDNPTPENQRLQGYVYRSGMSKIDREQQAPATAKRRKSPAVDSPEYRKKHPNVGQGKGCGGRKPGAGNATPRILKELVFTAMDMVGRDGRGKDKAAGYLARVAVRHPDIFGRFIEKLIPYTLSGPGGGPVQVTYDDKDAILQRMKERGMPIPRTLSGPEGQLKGAPENGEATGLQAGIEAGVVQMIVERPVQESIVERDGEFGEILPIEGLSSGDNE